MTDFHIATIPGDGIGPEVTDATFAVLDAVADRVGGFSLNRETINAGAAHYQQTGFDIEPHGEERAGQADAIFLGAIGLPAIRAQDGTEISPHLRLRERYELYAGVRPVKAYQGAPMMLASPQAASLDLVIIRECTEGLFYTAAVHDRSPKTDDSEARETLRITRSVTERLVDFAFRLAQRRAARGKGAEVRCVDKANVFQAFAYFRQIFDERKKQFPDIPADYAYVDAMALELVRRPWDFDVLVMENIFGDILSDLAGGLVGGMGMASSAEIGDNHCLFQPAHGSAPDIMGQDKANPLAAILSGALMLDWLGHQASHQNMIDAADLIDRAVATGFSQGALDPMEFGGNMGLADMTKAMISSVKSCK